MTFIDYDMLEGLDTEAFRATWPFPWWNPRGLLREEGFRALLDSLPPLEQFQHAFGKRRRGGQAPHDRYSLEYTPDTPVSPAWKSFIDELRGARYRGEIARLFGARKVEFRFHWHYTPSGRGVSPHCDSPREHGSHIFYFNAEDDWDPAWGGNTLVLHDGGRLDYNTAPRFEEFDRVIECDALGNASALLKRDDHGWHAVRPIACPEGKMRRVFIVVVNPDALYWKVRDGLLGKKKQRL